VQQLDAFLFGERKSDNSGKKLKIGSLTLPISPRSIAIPSASDATLFETDFMSCSGSASKVTFSTRRPEISSEPLKCHSNTSLPLRATSTPCILASLEAARRSAILAQRTAVDELILIDGGDGPAVSRDRNTAAVGRVREHRQRGERCQRSSAEK
jgi:hypothetical protein